MTMLVRAPLQSAVKVVADMKQQNKSAFFKKYIDMVP